MAKPLLTSVLKEPAPLSYAMIGNWRTTLKANSINQAPKAYAHFRQIYIFKINGRKKTNKKSKGMGEERRMTSWFPSAREK